MAGVTKLNFSCSKLLLAFNSLSDSPPVVLFRHRTFFGRGWILPMFCFVSAAEKVKLSELWAALNACPLWRDKTEQTHKDTTFKAMSVSVSSVLPCQEGQPPLFFWWET